MNKMVETYNTAVELILENELEKAASLLDDIIRVNRDDSFVHWTRGLIDVLCGFPQQAIYHWSHVKEHEIPQVVSRIKEVEETVPQYNKIYETYNEAIVYIANENYEEAQMIMRKLIEQGKSIPLPKECYQAYVLLLLIDEKVDEASEQIEILPDYMKNFSNFNRMQKIVQVIQQNEKTVKRGQLRKYLYSSGIVASVFAGAVLMRLIMLDDTQPTMVVSDPNIQLSEVIAELEEEHEEKINSLQSQLNDLTIDFTDVENELHQIKDERQAFAETLALSNIDVETIENQAARNAYQNGMEAFRQGNYEQSTHWLSNSIDLSVDHYYSDDAMYFLIQAFERSGVSTVELEETIDRFIRLTETSFAQSPYVDDILLQKANLLIKAEKIDLAIEILEKLTSEYGAEWTGQRAQTILRELARGL